MAGATAVGGVPMLWSVDGTRARFVVRGSPIAWIPLENAVWNPPYAAADPAVLPAVARRRLSALVGCRGLIADRLRHALNRVRRNELKGADAIAALVYPTPVRRTDDAEALAAWRSAALTFRPIGGAAVTLPGVNLNTDTIRELKERLQMYSVFAVAGPEYLRFVRNHRTLDDGLSAAAAGLHPGAVVNVVRRLVAGPVCHDRLGPAVDMVPRVNVAVQVEAYGCDYAVHGGIEPIGISARPGVDTYADVVRAAATLSVHRRVAWPAPFWVGAHGVVVASLDDRIPTDPNLWLSIYATPAA